MSEPIYRQVQRDLEGRANGGKEQYGEHLTADTKIDGLQYLYEELLDGSNYIRKAMEDRRALIEYVARLEGAVRYAKRQFDSHAGEDIPSEIMSEVLATSPISGQPQPAPATGWGPIAEAPRDFTPIEAGVSGSARSIRVVQWDTVDKCWYLIGGKYQVKYDDSDFTHFRLLSAPPKEGE